MAETLKELRSLSDDELIIRYDQHTKSTVVGIGHYLRELERRENERMTNTMIEYTRRIKYMTLFIAIMTIANVIMVAYSIYR